MTVRAFLVKNALETYRQHLKGLIREVPPPETERDTQILETYQGYLNTVNLMLIELAQDDKLELNKE